MATASIEDLMERVRLLLEQSSLRDAFRGVAIEPAHTYGDDEVLRVYIQVAEPDRIPTEDAVAVSRQVVDDLSELDDRFPSVRFAEAA